MFELMTPFNKVVCNYGTKGLVKLIGIRRRDTGFDVGIETYKEYPQAQSFPLNSFDEIIKTFDKVEPLYQEGYVIVDHRGNRAKVKHPGYVALHHMKSHFSVRYLVEVARKAEVAEVISYFPEWTDLLLAANEAIDDLSLKIHETYEVYKDIPIQKDFALAVVKHPFSWILFGLRNGQIKSIRELISEDLHIDQLISLLGVKEKLESMIIEAGKRAK
jgi:hypothetical protein